MILRFRKPQDAAIGERSGAKCERFHPGKGQPPGHLSRIDVDDDGLSPKFAARLKRTFQKYKQSVGWLAAVNESIARFEAQLFRLTEEPFDLVFWQVREDRDALQFGDFRHWT